MTALAQGLPVIFVPEQPRIAPVRDNMVNNGGWSQPASPHAGRAQRVLFQKRLPCGLPFPVVATKGGTAAQGIGRKLRRMLRAVHLPRFAKARTARLPAGAKGCMRHGITSQNNQAAVVVDGITAVQVLHGSVKAHDQRHRAVNLLGGLFLVDFDVSGWVGAHEHIVHVPTEHRVPTVDELLLQHQPHQLLGRRGHIPEALPEGHHGKAVILQGLHHHAGVPAVIGNLADVVVLVQLEDELLDPAIIDHIP